MKDRLLVVDLDGTLVDTVNGVLDTLETCLGIKAVSDDCRNYDVATSFWQNAEVPTYFRNQEAFSRFLTHACWTNAEFYAALEPYHDLRSAVCASMDRGTTTVALTARPPSREIRRVTRAWAARWLPGAHVHFSGQVPGGKSGFIKRLLERYRVVVVVEDDPKIIRELRELDAGVHCLVPHRPWTTEVYQHVGDPLHVLPISPALGVP
jgi:hypothetical protein